MRLVDFLRSEAVISDLSGRTSEEILTELSKPMSGAGDPARLTAALIARERLGSTGIGGGFAIPHAKVRDFPGLMASFGRAPSGIEFGAIDNQPVRLFFLLLAPEGGAGAHLKALARISRVFRSQPLRDAILAAPGAAEIHRLIAAADAAADAA